MHFNNFFNLFPKLKYKIEGGKEEKRKRKTKQASICDNNFFKKMCTKK